MMASPVIRESLAMLLLTPPNVDVFRPGLSSYHSIADRIDS
jgi:hypothetical protein